MTLLPLIYAIWARFTILVVVKVGPVDLGDKMKLSSCKFAVEFHNFSWESYSWGNCPFFLIGKGVYF